MRQDTTLSHREYLSARRFERLDGVRALSVLLVFTAHPGYARFWPAAHGAAGVSIFFVLSGFLITTLLAREHAASGRIDLSRFYVRRLFRIYPTFFLILAAYCLLILVVGLQSDRRDLFTENIAYFVFFLPEHALFANSSGTPVPFDGAWSIGIEEKFYVLWPVLGFLVLGLLARLRLVVLSVAVVTLGVISISTSWGRWISPYALISLGAIAALVLDSRSGYRIVRHLGRPLPLAVLSLLVVAVQFGVSQILSPGRLYVAYGVLIVAALVGLVVSTSRVPDVLATRPLVYLGKISYVFYLVHNFALNLVEPVVPRSTQALGPSVVSALIALVISVVVSSGIHHWFEEPLRRYGAKLSGRGGHRVRATETLPPVSDDSAA